MRKHLVSVTDATEELARIGYSLRTRKGRNAITASLLVLKSSGKERELLEGLSRPSVEVQASHPELIAWLTQNAIIDGSNLVVL